MTAKMNKETQEQIQQLQLLQQRAQIFATQKQQYQLQLTEIDTAIKEIQGTKKPVYKMVGGLLVEKKLNEVKKELSVIQQELQIKIKNLEKQEGTIRKKLADVQRDVAKKIK